MHPRAAEESGLSQKSQLIQGIDADSLLARHDMQRASDMVSKRETSNSKSFNNMV